MSAELRQSYGLVRPGHIRRAFTIDKLPLGGLC